MSGISLPPASHESIGHGWPTAPPVGLKPGRPSTRREGSQAVGSLRGPHNQVLMESPYGIGIRDIVPFSTGIADARSRPRGQVTVPGMLDAQRILDSTRRSPHSSPAAYDDAIAAIRWVHEALGSPLALAGPSAGANLALGVSHPQPVWWRNCW